MKVTEVMSTGIEWVTEEDSVMTAADKMRSIDAGVLPVRNTEDKMTGMITDRDIVVRAVADGKDPNTATVREAMTTGVVSCPVTKTVEEAAALMEREQIRRLVVLDEDSNPVGILALGDIAVKTPGEELPGEALKEVSKPA